MKKVTFYILAFITLAFLYSCKKEESKEVKPVIICEEFRPFNYLENNELKGISVEIADSIMGLLGINDRTIAFTTNWDSAFELVKTAENVALFTTNMTAERKNVLQWVGPVTLTSTGFTGLKSSNLEVTSITDAKNLPSVGVVTGYSTTETLENLDFANLVYFNTISTAISALYAGSISSLFDVTQSVRSIAEAGGMDVNLLDEIYNFSTLQGYIAFSPGTSSQTVKSWQDKLDQLKKQGYVQAVYNKYLPGTKAPGLVSIYTESNPPQSYLDNEGSLTGSSVEIVQAMMTVIGRDDLITLTNWTDAYDQVLLNPNSMIFSTARTTQREPYFEWVGPVCKKNACFFVKTGSPVQLNTIDDAKTLGTIGVPEGWSSENELIGLGFTNIQTWATPQEVFEKLIEGTADAVVLNDIAISYLADQTGHNPDEVRNELLFSPGETFLAFSKDTKSSYTQEWNQAYTTITNNGTFAGIWNKWYPGINW